MRTLAGPIISTPPIVTEWITASISRPPSVMARTRDEAFAYFHQLTEERRARPQDDLISILTHSAIDGVPLDAR